MVAVILHVANTIAARAIGPPDDVVPPLRSGDLALHICQQLLRLGQGQPQFGDIAKAIRPADLHEIRAWILTLGASLHQPQNPCHAPTPDPRSEISRENTQLVLAPPVSRRCSLGVVSTTLEKAVVKLPPAAQDQTNRSENSALQR